MYTLTLDGPGRQSVFRNVDKLDMQLFCVDFAQRLQQGEILPGGYTSFTLADEMIQHLETGDNDPVSYQTGNAHITLRARKQEGMEAESE